MFRALIGVAVISIAVLLVVAASDHVGGRNTGPGVPSGSVDAGTAGTINLPLPENAASDADGPRVLPDVYRGNTRIVGIVALENGQGVADAEVTCTPMGFRPLRVDEFAALTMRTDASGFFSFGDQPDAFHYEIVAFTASLYGCIDLSRAQATDGRLVVTVAPMYYTRHEFTDAAGSPITRLPKEVQQLISGRIVTSTHAGWPPDLARTRILERMGIRMPEDLHVVATVFGVPPGPPRPATVLLDLAGYTPVSVGFAPRPLSEWPKGEVVHLQGTDDDRGRVLYDVEIPEAGWPPEWGERDPSMDFRIWFVQRGTKLFSSVNRRTPAFSFPPDVEFDLRDQNERELRYTIIRDKARRIVRPAYPEYGFLRVQWPRILDSTKHYGATVRAKDDTEGRDITGVDAVPGETLFGPLAVGEYEVQIQWFMAGSTSALSPVRHLGTVTVRKGANDIRCE